MLDYVAVVISAVAISSFGTVPGKRLARWGRILFWFPTTRDGCCVIFFKDDDHHQTTKEGGYYG
ncbi:MAG: hypothetical protein HQL87_06150 [Magnetococcales bacterium]|nr:hypothetical protein [Magnetococcales bacterium]